MAFQYLHSQTLYPEDIATEFDQPLGIIHWGYAYDFEVQPQCQAQLELVVWSTRDRDPGLSDVDSGFVPRVDLRRRRRASGIRRTFWGDDKKPGSISFNLGAFVERVEDHRRAADGRGDRVIYSTVSGVALQSVARVGLFRIHGGESVLRRRSLRGSAERPLLSTWRLSPVERSSWTFWSLVGRLRSISATTSQPNELMRLIPAIEAKLGQTRQR